MVQTRLQGDLPRQHGQLPLQQQQQEVCTSCCCCPQAAAAAAFAGPPVPVAAEPLQSCSSSSIQHLLELLLLPHELPELLPELSCSQKLLLDVERLLLLRHLLLHVLELLLLLLLRWRRAALTSLSWRGVWALLLLRLH
jgi:hypothetical protein